MKEKSNSKLFQFALMETVTTAILDKFPNLRQYKTWVVLFVGVFGYIGGIGFTTRVSIVRIWVTKTKRF